MRELPRSCRDADAGCRGRVARLGLAAACALLVLAVGATGALAHATLLRAEPVDGSVLPAAPASVILTFNEPVTLLDARLYTPSGEATALREEAAEGERIVLAPQGELPRGTFALRWKAVSQDGHPVGDTLVFSVRETAGTALATALAQGPGLPVQAFAWITWVAMLAGLLVGTGGALFSAFAGPGGRARLGPVRAALAAGLAATPLALAAEGLDALDLPLVALGRAAPWSTGFATSFGTTCLLAGLAMALAGTALAASQGAAARLASCASIAAAAAALAASGHAAAAAPQLLSRPAVAAHAACAALWIGALPLLAGMLGRPPPSGVSGLARFSRAAPLAVAILAGSGAVLAIRQVESPAALVGTAYGLVLLAKLLLVALLLALAGWNRWRLTVPALAGDTGSRRALARLAAAECVLSLLILGLVGLWRFTPPPRVLAEAAAVPTEIHLHTAEAMAEVTVVPGRRGPVSIVLMILDGDFGPLDAADVSLVLTSPAGRPITLSAAKPGDGTWRVERVDLPEAGRWTMHLAIRDRQERTFPLDGTLDIRP